jgi:hypothetical protein
MINVEKGGGGGVHASDSASVDAFSRWRTSQPFGIFDNKNIASRNRNQWEEIIGGAIITYSGLTGTFQAAEEIRGTSPARFIPVATINTDNGSNSMNVDCDHNDFEVGDTITGQTSGATATVVSANTGSNVQHDYDRASVILTTGTGATDRAIRSTHRYHAYVPGKGNLALLTFIFGSPVTNVTRRVGNFDDLNGLFLEQTETDIAFIVRTSTSGSASDAVRIVQDDWNVDSFDGTGPSGISVDFTKAQILFIDYQWLGVGRVRFGFDIDGQIKVAHEVRNANAVDVVYMRTPSLPIRYEIKNTGVTASQTTFEEICSSLASEGGYALPGLEFTASRKISFRGVTTEEPILAIRLKNEFPSGKPNRRMVKFLNASATAATNDAHIDIAHLHEPIDITATWIDVGGGSAVEYSLDISAITGRPRHDIESSDITVGVGNRATSDIISGEFISSHSFLSQDFNSTNSQVFLVYATAITGTSNLLAHISWIEFD